MIRIGVFDSGVGGLTVLKSIRQQLPHAELHYIADHAFAPYGEKTTDVIQQRSDELINALLLRQPDLLVIACNTATAAAIEALRSRITIPIIGVEPGLKPAILRSQCGVVGVLATASTVNSQRFQQMLQRHQQQAEIISVAGVGLVEQIEQGSVRSTALTLLLQQYLQPMLNAGADVISLGCTHYAFLTPLIHSLSDGRLAVIDTAEAVAKQVERVAGSNAYNDTVDGCGHVFFYTTGNLMAANALLSALWDTPYQLRPFSQLASLT